jgi:hypothetical protein
MPVVAFARDFFDKKFYEDRHAEAKTWEERVGSFGIGARVYGDELFLWKKGKIRNFIHFSKYERRRFISGLMDGAWWRAGFARG